MTGFERLSPAQLALLVEVMRAMSGVERSEPVVIAIPAAFDAGRTISESTS